MLTLLHSKHSAVQGMFTKKKKSHKHTPCCRLHSDTEVPSSQFSSQELECRFDAKQKEGFKFPRALTGKVYL